jgi:ABC-type transport system involved in cytochrome c biogenesis permease component
MSNLAPPVATAAPAAEPVAGTSSPLVTFFVRETGEVVRGRESCTRRVLFLAATVILTLIGAKAGSGSSGAGRAAFMGPMMVNLVFLIAITSENFTRAIMSDRKDGTLDLLRISGLSPLAIVMGKATSHFAGAVLLLLAQWPLAGYCLTLGGITPGEMFSAYALAGALFFFAYHLAVFWTVVSKTSRAASHATMGTLAACYFIPWALVMINGKMAGVLLPASVVEWVWQLVKCNPVTAYRTVILSGIFPLGAVIFHVAGGVFFLLMAARRFEAACEEVEAQAAVAAVKSRPDRKILARLGPLPRPGKWAIAWKEYYFAAGGWSNVQTRWILYPALALVFATLGGGATTVGDRVGWAAALVGCAGLLGEIPYAANRMFGWEVTEKTLSDIAILPIRPRRLVGEKAVAYLPSLAPPIFLVVAGVALTGTWPWRVLKLPVDWLGAGYALVQLALVLVVTVHFSLSQPKSASGGAFLFIAVINLLLVLLWVVFRFPLVVYLPCLIALGTWLLIRVGQAVPAAIQLSAAK